MENFAAMNRVYDTFFEHPKPVRQLSKSIQIYFSGWLTTLPAGPNLRCGERVAYENGCRDRVCCASVSVNYLALITCGRGSVVRFLSVRRMRKA